MFFIICFAPCQETFADAGVGDGGGAIWDHFEISLSPLWILFGILYYKTILGPLYPPQTFREIQKNIYILSLYTYRSFLKFYIIIYFVYVVIICLRYLLVIIGWLLSLLGCIATGAIFDSELTVDVERPQSLFHECASLVVDCTLSGSTPGATWSLPFIFSPTHNDIITTRILARVRLWAGQHAIERVTHNMYNTIMC